MYVKKIKNLKKIKNNIIFSNVWTHVTKIM
jgi:hypothetical protein